MARRRAVSGGRQTDYDWELSRGTDLARASGSIVQFEAFLADSAETLMRLRGDVSISLAASGATQGDVLVAAYGVIRSASGSSDVGVSPLTEGGANWLLYGVTTLILEAAVNNSLGQGLAIMRWQADSKAMRRLRENESLYVVFESADISGAPVANYTFALRGLTGR